MINIVAPRINRVYGEISVNGNTSSTVLTAQNTWYQVSVFNTNGLSNGASPSHTEDHITVNSTKRYKVTVSTSFSGSASSTYELEVKKNNGESSFINLHCERALGASGDIGSTSISGIISLTAGDTVEFWARCTSGSSKSITIRDVTLSIESLN